MEASIKLLKSDKIAFHINTVCVNVKYKIYLMKCNLLYILQRALIFIKIFPGHMMRGEDECVILSLGISLLLADLSHCFFE